MKPRRARWCRRRKRVGRTFGVAYYRRTYPKVQRAKQLLDAGVIGKPFLAELTCHGWFDENKPGHRSWLLDPAQGGRRSALRHRLAPHRRAELFIWSTAAGHRPSFECGSSLCGGRQCDCDDRIPRRSARHRGCSLAFKVRRDECRIRGTEGEMDLSPLNGPELIYPGGHESLATHANVHIRSSKTSSTPFLAKLRC